MIPRLESKARQIIDDTAREWGMTAATMLYRGKSNGKVQARRQAIRDLRAAGLSLSEIGRLMNMHHTTVLYHLQADPGAHETGIIRHRGKLTVAQCRRVIEQQAKRIREMANTISSQAAQIAEMSEQVERLVACG